MSDRRPYPSSLDYARLLNPACSWLTQRPSLYIPLPQITRNRLRDLCGRWPATVTAGTHVSVDESGPFLLLDPAGSQFVNLGSFLNGGKVLNGSGVWSVALGFRWFPTADQGTATRNLLSLISGNSGLNLLVNGSNQALQVQTGNSSGGLSPAQTIATLEADRDYVFGYCSTNGFQNSTGNWWYLSGRSGQSNGYGAGQNGTSKFIGRSQGGTYIGMRFYFLLSTGQQLNAAEFLKLQEEWQAGWPRTLRRVPARRAPAPTSGPPASTLFRRGRGRRTGTRGVA